MASPGPHTRLGAATWSTLMLNDGDIILPPDAFEGAVIVTAKTAQNLDQQSASGKDKAKTVQKGRKPVDIGITLTFTALGWPKIENVLMQISPDGPSRGGPFKTSHPNLDWRQVKAMMVGEIGDVEWTGQKGTVKITATEWEEPKKVVAGGVKKGAGGQDQSIQVELLQGQIISLQAEIADIDDRLGFFKRAFLTQDQLQNLMRQREDLASKLAQDRSALDQTLAQQQNTSNTPTTTQSGASQNTVPGQGSKKTAKADPYAASTGPNADP